MTEQLESIFKNIPGLALRYTHRKEELNQSSSRFPPGRRYQTFWYRYRNPQAAAPARAAAAAFPQPCVLSLFHRGDGAPRKHSQELHRAAG